MVSEVNGYQTQSARGDNQQRPGSGYGTTTAGPSGVGGSSGGVNAGPNVSSSTSTYHQQAGVNSILSPHGLEGTEQDDSPYGHVYPSGGGNNGVGGDPY